MASPVGVSHYVTLLTGLYNGVFGQETNDIRCNTALVIACHYTELFSDAIISQRKNFGYEVKISVDQVHMISRYDIKFYSLGCKFLHS